MKLSSLCLAAVLFFSGGQVALAIEPCGEVVVDTAGVLRNQRSVELAAAELAAATGADVRVRITDDYAPEANLDRHVDEVAKTVCTSWTLGDGYHRANLVILWVTMTRDVGLYYGNQWERALGRSWPLIKEQDMKPYLQRGDFDGAFVAALTAIKDTIETAEAPPTSRTAPAAEQAAPAAPSVVVVEKEPVDYSRVYLFLIWAGVLVVLALLGRSLLRLYYSFREEEGKRHAERDRAVSAEQTALRLLNELNPLDEECEALLSSFKGKVAQSSLAAFVARLKSLEDRGLGLRGSFEDAPRVDASRQSLIEYKEMVNTLGNVVASLTATKSDFQKLRDELKEVDVAIEAVPVEYQALRGRVPGYWQRIHNVAAAGFTVKEAEAKFSAADAKLSVVQNAIEQLDWAKAEEALTEANEQYEAAAKAAEALPERKVQIIERLGEVREQLDGVGQYREKDARVAFAAMEQSYAEDCYRSILGNGTEATLREEEITADLDAIQGFIDGQEWQQAEDALKEASEAIKVVETLLMAIVKRERDLKKTAENAAAELTEAVRSVGVAREYLREHPEHEAPNHKEMLKRADDCIELAKNLLAGQLPNVERAFTVADEADTAADAVYAAIKDGVDRVKAQKARITRLSQELASTTDDLSTYLTLHAGDVGDEFGRQLEGVRARVRKRNGEDLAGTITKLTAALQAAEQLRADAHRVVREAEEERAAARRRREEEERNRRRRQSDMQSASRRSTSFGHSSSFGSSRSPGFGGGSSSFGGTRGFGGGSSKW